MLAGRPDRAGLALEIEEGQRVEVRNRRPGDRIRPLGAGGSRRLKEVLIDRRVPRDRRDRLPLLVVGGAIAWVPGVTIDERFRLDDVLDGLDGRDGVRAGATAWSAEIEAL
jgi:tRNA(Ile)-lysidine synthetase-like protein